MANDEVGNLRVSLSLDSSDFNRPLASVDRNLKALGGELAEIRNRGREWGESINGLRTRQEVLGRTLSTQETKVQRLRQAYERSAAEQGESAAATERLAVQLNRAVAEYARTETELAQVNTSLAEQQEELRHTESAWGRMETSLDSASDRLTAAGDKMKGIGEKMTVGITTPILGIGAAAIKTADDFDKSQGKLQAQLGLTAEEAEELGDVAQSLWENAFGEDLTEVGDNLAIIKQNIKGLNNGELETFAEGAYAIQDAFGAEINETTKTASTLMKNFGIEGSEALDLITTGFQRGGDFSGELLDTMNEYSPTFQGLGYSADEFTAILIAGAESGAFSMDKIGDAAKEAFLRIGDGSKSSRDSLEVLGLNFEQIEEGINSGGDAAKSSFAAVVAAIATVEDPAERAQTAVALLGSPIEDLGPEFQTFFADVNTDLGDFKGSTKAAGDALYDNLGSRATSVFRDFQSDLEPAGEILIDLAEEWLPKVAGAISDVTESFGEMSPKAQENAIMIAGVAAAAGPALVVIGSLATGLGSVAKFGSTLAGALGRAGGAGLIGRIGLMGMAGPVGLAVAGVGLLAGGIYAVTKASELNVEESIKAIEAKQAEIAKNDELIASYEGLQAKNSLSNDEMLRFLDIQALLQETKAPETIAALKEEQSLLLEKSTLTNDEMNNFLALNEDLIEAAPDTVKAISEQGEAFALNTEAVRELNAEKAKEMENDARELLTESLERERGLLQEQKELIAGINEANALQAEQKQIVSDKARIIADTEREIKELEEQKNGASLEQTVELDNQIQRKEELLWQAGDEKAKAEDLLGTYGKQMAKKDEELEKNRQSLAQTDAAIYKYEEIILAQAGITAEKGRGLQKVNEEIGKLETQKGKLSDLLRTGKINTAEYENQNGKIDAQIGRLREAKGELELINDVAGETVYKDVQIQENPRNFWNTLDSNLRRTVYKNVSIRYNSMNGPQEVGAYAHGGTHKGGPAIVGDGIGNNAGPELMRFPSGRTALSPATPTMLHLPKGTSILSAMKTRQKLANVPQYANGTPDTFGAGSMNPQVIADAVASAIGNIMGGGFNINPAAVNLDGQRMGEIQFAVNDRLFGAASNKSAWRSGVRE